MRNAAFIFWFLLGISFIMAFGYYLYTEWNFLSELFNNASTLVDLIKFFIKCIIRVIFDIGIFILFLILYICGGKNINDWT